VKQNLQEIKENLKSRKKTDRIMWFSMWIILSIASFGIAWFPMTYYLIKRRNAHFQRQEKLESLILNKLKGNGKKASSSSKKQNLVPSRNARAWAVLSLLVVPAFYVFYFLKSDLEKHVTHEHDFFAEMLEYAMESGVTLNIHGFMASKKFALGKYVVLSGATLGLAAAYWLYRIFNDYNNHFKMQWKIEDELLSFLKVIDQKYG
jgi:hypothetical protein